MTKAQEMLAKRIETNPLGWLLGVGDCINITFTPEEAKLLTAALRLAAQADAPDGQPQTSKQRQPGDEVVYFNGRLVTWAEVEAAVQEWKCSHTRPDHDSQSALKVSSQLHNTQGE